MPTASATARATMTSNTIRNQSGISSPPFLPDLRECVPVDVTPGNIDSSRGRIATRLRASAAAAGALAHDVREVRRNGLAAGAHRDRPAQRLPLRALRH